MFYKRYSWQFSVNVQFLIVTMMIDSGVKDIRPESIWIRWRKQWVASILENRLLNHNQMESTLFWPSSFSHSFTVFNGLGEALHEKRWGKKTKRRKLFHKMRILKLRKFSCELTWVETIINFKIRIPKIYQKLAEKTLEKHQKEIGRI